MGQIFLIPNCNILVIFKYNQGRTTLFSDMTPTKKRTTNYCIRFGRSLWSADQLPAQEGLNRRFEFSPKIKTASSRFTVRSLRCSSTFGARSSTVNARLKNNTVFHSRRQRTHTPLDADRRKVTPPHQTTLFHCCDT